MSNIPFWHKDRVSWDNVILGGEICPGSVNRVEGASARRQLDIKKAPGRTGATITDQGYQPAKFSVVCVITTESELQAWELFIERLRPAPDKAPAAFDVVHPELSLLGISACYVETIHQLSRGEKDIREGKIDFVEFLPLSTKANGKVKKSSDFKIADTANPRIATRTTAKGTKAKDFAPSKTIQPSL